MVPVHPAWANLAQAVVAATAPLQLHSAPQSGQQSRFAGWLPLCAIRLRLGSKICELVEPLIGVLGLERVYIQLLGKLAIVGGECLV